MCIGLYWSLDFHFLFLLPYQFEEIGSKQWMITSLCQLHQRVAPSVFMQKRGCYVSGERAEISGVLSLVLNIGMHERTVSVQSGPVSSDTVEIKYLLCLGRNKNQNRRKAFK